MRRPDELGQNSMKNWEEEDEKEKKNVFLFFACLSVVEGGRD